MINIFLLDNFVTKHNSICENSNKYNRHEVLSFAELACEKDTSCMGIIDDNCDKIGSFYLCKTGFVTLDDSNERTCVYQKKKTIGTSQLECNISIFCRYIRCRAYNLFYLSAEPTTECFDVSFSKTYITRNTRWTIGDCSSSLEYSYPGVYTENCCVSPVDIILTCANPDNDDWSRNVLTLLGHEFCNDYVGNHAMIRLNIKGKINDRYTRNLIKFNHSFLLRSLEIFTFFILIELITSTYPTNASIEKGNLIIMQYLVTHTNMTHINFCS